MYCNPNLVKKNKLIVGNDTIIFFFLSSLFKFFQLKHYPKNKKENEDTSLTLIVKNTFKMSNQTK